MAGRTLNYVADVPCGNMVTLTGIDKYLIKTGTISDYPDANIIRPMKYSASPVVQISVAPKDPADLPKLVEGLQKLGNADPLAICSVEETG